jgi:cytochrome c oxidase subunit 2
MTMGKLGCAKRRHALPGLARLGLGAGALLAAAAALAGGTGGAALYAPCAACHGARGQGDVRQGAPNIAGLEAAYVQRQLEHFAAGGRGAEAQDAFGARMRGAVQSLDAPARQALATYVAALPPMPAAASTRPSGNLVQGRNYFNAICSACHNGNGLGSPALSAPRLAGTEPQYLLRQLAAFRRGTRGATAQDSYGAQMRKMVATLPGAAIERDIVAYVATLPVPGAGAGP